MNVPKSLIRSLYDLQAIRIQTGNRIVVEIKSRMGQAPGKKEDESVTPEGKQYLAAVRSEYKRIADAFVLQKAANYFKVNYGDYQIISDPVMLLFARIYEEQLRNEAEMEKVIKRVVEKHPLWDAFLRDVKGIGPLMSAVVLSEFDINKACRISQFWAYAGLDVVISKNDKTGEDESRGRGRYKEHLIDVDYVNKKGEKATKKSITFNPFLKTKLYVLAECFLKIKTCKYREFYDNYKHRIENMPKHVEKSKGHRHAMSMRYMQKMFLQDLWLAWRELEGLEITKPYSEAVLGHNHHK